MYFLPYVSLEKGLIFQLKNSWFYEFEYNRPI